MIAGGWAISRHTDGWREKEAGGTEVPPRGAPFLRRHGLPTAAARSAGGQARQQSPAAGLTHPGCHPPRQHPAGSRRCPGDASAGDRIGKSERRGIGGGDDERGRLRLPSVRLRWRIFTSCGSNKREPLDSSWKAEIQEMSHCDMPTLCHPI